MDARMHARTHTLHPLMKITGCMKEYIVHFLFYILYISTSVYYWRCPRHQSVEQSL